jgi:predicted TIM-barrel fold metal-dependent hydrolase
MIDAHLHVVPTGLPGTGSLGVVLRLPPDQTAEELRQEMQATGTTTALAMGAWRITADDPLGVNRTLQIAEMVPGLLAVGVMDPTRAADDVEFFAKVEAVLQAKKVVALKGYLGYLPCGPDHPTYHVYYDLAAKYRLPVFFHTGDTYSPQARLKFAHPLLVDEVAVDHPDTRFVICHVGNPWTVDAAAVVYKNVNVWTDLSGLVVGDGTEFEEERYRDGIADLADRVRKAFRYAERPNRFLYGSDWPLMPMETYRNFVRSLIPTEHHDAVFEENARTLFRI